MRKVIEGLLWAGYKGECKGKVPCYILKNTTTANSKANTFDDCEDGIYLCDILKKFAAKQIIITIAQAGISKLRKEEIK